MGLFFSCVVMEQFPVGQIATYPECQFSFGSKSPRFLQNKRKHETI